MLSVKGLLTKVLGSGTPASCGDCDSDIHPTVRLPPVEPVQIENSQEKRDRALKHLLRLNHMQHALIYNEKKEEWRGKRKFNTLPHHLSSAYLMGANERHLHEIYDSEDGKIEAWTPSPGEVTEEDWQDFLGDDRYQRAYLDFFEDEIVRQGYDWKSVLMEFLLKGDKPLLNGLICGLAYPLIRLGYAIELDSREMAMESLTLVATKYNLLHKFVDVESPERTSTSPPPTNSPYEILEKIHANDQFQSTGPQDFTHFFTEREDLILTYFNMLDMANTDLTWLFGTLTKLVTTLFLTTHDPKTRRFNFVFANALGACWAVRTVLPVLPAKQHLVVLRALWMLILYVYITQMRPKVPRMVEYITDSDFEEVEKRWVIIQENAMAECGRGMKDEKYIEVLRVFKEFALLWKKDCRFYFTAAVKFAEEYSGEWAGEER